MVAAKPRGRPRKLSNRAAPGVVRRANENKLTARMVLDELQVQVSLRMVQRTLANDENMVFRVLKARTHLFHAQKKVA